MRLRGIEILVYIFQMCMSIRMSSLVAKNSDYKANSSWIEIPTVLEFTLVIVIVDKGLTRSDWANTLSAAPITLPISVSFHPFFFHHRATRIHCAIDPH